MELELDKIYNIDCADGLQNLPQGHKYCIVTDPPFNIGYHYNEYKDRMDEGEYYKWLAKLIGDLPCVIIHYPESLYKLSFTMQRFPTKVLSWCYNSNTPKQHRDIAFFGIKPDMSKVKQPYKNPNDKRIRERIANGSKGASIYDWMVINQVKNVSKKDFNGTKHPCQMPEEVMRRIVGVIPDDYVILDPFVGSGTTAVAAIANKKHFIGFELNEQYAKMAEHRIFGIKLTDDL